MASSNEFRLSELTPLQLLCGTVVVSVAIIGLTIFFCTLISYDYHYKLKRLEIWHQEERSDE